MPKISRMAAAIAMILSTARQKATAMITQATMNAYMPVPQGGPYRESLSGPTRTSRADAAIGDADLSDRQGRDWGNSRFWPRDVRPCGDYHRCITIIC